MSIAWRTWARRWLAPNHPLCYLPALKIIHASLSRNVSNWSEGIGVDAPVVIMQRTPLCSQKVRYYEGLSLTLGLWSPILVSTPPVELSLIILEESRLIMSNEDEAFGFMGAWNRLSSEWKRIPIVVKMEAVLIIAPLSNKCVPVVNNVLLFMSVNIHTICVSAIMPAQPGEPSPSCPFGDGRLADPNPLEMILQLRACNNIHDISGFNKPTLRYLGHLKLDLLGNIFIIQDSPSIPTILIMWKLIKSEIIKQPLLNCLHTSHPQPF
jgi:hypothetical protein